MSQQIETCYVESWPKALKSQGRMRCDRQPSSSRKTAVLTPSSLSPRTPEGRSNQRVWARTFGDSRDKVWFLTDHWNDVWINKKTMTPEMAAFLVVSQERVVDPDDLAAEHANAEHELFARVKRSFARQVAEVVAPYAAAAWADPDEPDEVFDTVREAVESLPEADLRAAFDAALAASGRSMADVADRSGFITGLGEFINGESTFEHLVDAGALTAYDFMPEREADLWYARRNKNQLALFENRRRRGSKRRSSKRRGSRRR